LKRLFSRAKKVIHGWKGPSRKEIAKISLDVGLARRTVQRLNEAGLENASMEELRKSPKAKHILESACEEDARKKIAVATEYALDSVGIGCNSDDSIARRLKIHGLTVKMAEAGHFKAFGKDAVLHQYERMLEEMRKELGPAKYRIFIMNFQRIFGKLAKEQQFAK